ncbi:MAG: D-isomer specific 2-hydroxyacid dehydrogenase family protein [Candidatus Woykebacteria bacterium]
MKIVITDRINFPADTMDRLRKVPGIEIYDDVPDKEMVIERIKDADVATAWYVDITREIIEATNILKYIIVPAVATDWVDKEAAKEKGIKVLNCPTFNSQAVAEHAIALMFAVKRQIVAANLQILNGGFNSKNFEGTEVKEKTLVTFGYGNIGKKVIEMAKGLGMETGYINTKTSEQEAEQLLKKADVLVMCLSLSEKSKEILNSERLSLLKTSAVVINVARGLVIEQDAFYKALTEGELAGAGIDTFPNDETTTTDGKTPEHILKFAKLPNVVATPHMGFKTKESMERLGDELIKNIESCIKGNPTNVVN